MAIIQLTMDIVQNWPKKYYVNKLYLKSFKSNYLILLYMSELFNFLYKFQIQWRGPYCVIKDLTMAALMVIGYNFNLLTSQNKFSLVLKTGSSSWNDEKMVPNLQDSKWIIQKRIYKKFLIIIKKLLNKWWLED